jgi:23S rRNA (pseudouridine1915-N3)-methyltransferase
LRITLIAPGKLKAAFWRAAAQEYADRLRRYVDFRTVEVKEIPPAKKSPRQIIEEETALVLNAAPEKGFLVLLDRRGQALSSDELAEFIERRRQQGPRDLVFAIGGPLGFAQDALKRADAVLAMSKMTFPHDLARVMLLEQLYRAFTILRGEKYHKS